jgi:transcriptional regulator with XRE-family HTH domain
MFLTAKAEAADEKIWKGVMRMDDLKKIVAKNIIDLRKANGMTQLDLAEHLNYTDKAVSKWERGESLPDISVLKGIADLFGVKVDYLLTEDHVEPVAEVLMAPDAEDNAEKRRHRRYVNRRVTTSIGILLVWLLATLTFVVLEMVCSELPGWVCFLYAVPASLVVWLIFNSIWFDGRRNFSLITLLMWSVLASLHISSVVFAAPTSKLWLIYILGVPGQAIILAWSRFMHRSK